MPQPALEPARNLHKTYTQPTLEDLYTPSYYARLTEGTVLAPWLPKALVNASYFGAPINVWSRESSLFERVMRVEQVGVVYGGLLGVFNGWATSASLGLRGTKMFTPRQSWIAGVHGFANGTLQFAAFPIAVTALAAVRGREERAFEWGFGALALAAVHMASAFKPVKGPFYAKKLNYLLLIPLPCLAALAKSLGYVNCYDDPKGGRHTMMAGGPQGHSTTEMRELYGLQTNVYKKTIDQSLETRKLLFLLPRADKSKNDKYSHRYSPVTANEESSTEPAN